MTHNTTILQLCPRLHSGGIERGTVDVAIALKQAGYTSLVASGHGKMVNELTHAGVTHIELPLHLKAPWHIHQNAKRLRQIILDHHIQLVHARSRAPIWAAYYATKGLNTTLITACHSPHGAGFLNLKKRYNRCIGYGERVIAISDFIADYLKQQYRLTPAKIRTIYRGIDMNVFNPDTITDQLIINLKQRYHIPSDKKIILLPGRITRWKGQDVFINALAQLVKTNAVHGLIVGRVDSIEFNKQLRQRITEHTLSQHITFIDECFDMPPLYAMADITLSCSRKPEAFGRVAVEGQAMRSVVIATRLGAAVETIVPYKTGFLVEPNDALQLEKMIQHALDLSPDEKKTLTQNARLQVEAQCSKHQMLTKTIDVYRECLT